MTYQPSLDGVRAVAILAVLAFHALPGYLPGGFTGVDVFFVLSGYLIGSVILYDIRAGTFSLKEFYLRRIQRLLPNATLTILVTVVLSVFMLLPSVAVNVARHGVWTLFNASNVYVWTHIGGYWGATAASMPLLHTWSLGVEEQFYLAFPLTLLLVSRLSPLRLPVYAAGLTLFSFALCAYFTNAYPSASFYLLPTRAWEPLLGAVLATCRIPAAVTTPLRSLSTSLSSEIIGFVGFAMMAAGFVFISDAAHFPGLVALVPTVGTLLVLASLGDGKSLTAQVLSYKPIVFVGQLSYSLYLWHWPLIVLLDTYFDLTGRSRQLGRLFGAILGVLLSLIAYYAIEKPFRRRGRGRTPRVAVIASTFALCVLVTSIVSSRSPLPDPDCLFNRPAFNGLLYDVTSDGSSDVLLSSTRYADVIVPPTEGRPVDIWKTGGILHTWGGATPRVVVLGSSHALMYGSLIDGICKQRGVSVAFLCANSSSPFFGDSPNSSSDESTRMSAFDEARLHWLETWNPDVVLVVDRWDSHDSGDFAGRLRQFVKVLGSCSQRIIFLSQVPVLRLGEDINLREYVTWHLSISGSVPMIFPDSCESSRVAATQAIDLVARSEPTVTLIRVDSLFYNSDGSVRYAADRTFYYVDDDHLSEEGAQLTRELLLRAIFPGSVP